MSFYKKASARKIIKKVAALILCVTILLTIIHIGSIKTATSNAKGLNQLSPPPKFVCRYIAALSDSDFLASTYDDGKLPEPNTSTTDKLSLINLPLNGNKESIAQINASNSVIGAPYALALAPDRRMAFVVETLGAIPIGATRREQLPPGRQLVAVDLSNPRQPKVHGTLVIAPKPETIDVHPNGKLLAISTQTPGKEIVLIPVRNDVFGQPVEFSLQQLGIQPDQTKFQQGISASMVQWHPSGRYLAVNLNYRDEIAFYQLQQDSRGNPQLIPWGTPVKVGKDPFTGRFTSDGRFYLTSNWGRNFGKQVKSLEERLPQTRGTVSVIQLAETKMSGAFARHRVVSTAIADISPESLAINPDGSLVVTVNMRGTLFPASSRRFSRQASLSLLQLDRKSGRLTKIADYPFEGILPESAAFDASGNYLAIAVYDYFLPKPEGGVELWQIHQKPKPILERTGYVIDVGRGVHQVLVAR